MGTSTSYTAPTGGAWTATKRLATRFARQGGADRGPVTPARLVGAYVQAAGGGERASVAAVAGRAAAQHIGGFFSSVATGGLAGALRDAGLDALVGQNTVDILAALVDNLAGPSRTLEEAAAHAAMGAVLEDEFGEADTFADLDALCAEGVDAAGVLRLMQRFLAEYIYLRVVEAIGDRLQAGATTIADACRAERDVRAFIVAAVDLDFGAIDPLHLDWQGAEAQRLVARLLAEAYDQLG